MPSTAALIIVSLSPVQCCWIRAARTVSATAVSSRLGYAWQGRPCGRAAARPSPVSHGRKSMEPVPEDWERAVAVVAHPDDLEYGAAAAVARWTSQGKSVSYALATSGEAGIAGLAPDKAKPLRE